MAKKSRSSKKVFRSVERGSFHDSSPWLLHNFRPLDLVLRRSVDDGFYPERRILALEKLYKADAVARRVARISGGRPLAAPFRFGRYSVAAVVRRNPLVKGLVCARRRMRREVLFSRLVAGRHGAGHGKPRRETAASNVRC